MHSTSGACRLYSLFLSCFFCAKYPLGHGGFASKHRLEILPIPNFAGNIPGHPAQIGFQPLDFSAGLAGMNIADRPSAKPAGQGVGNSDEAGSPALRRV